MTRVLIVDDHPVVRAGLRLVLAGQPGIKVVAEAETGSRAIELARELEPDVVLCDLRLGDGMDGVGVAAALRGRDDPAVLILTTYDHDSDIVRAVEAGAVGYLLKDADPDEIVRAVEAAAAGESILSEEQTQRVVATMRSAPTRALSEREIEVLGLVGEGLSNRAIAKALFVSEATVKTHLAHANDKLGTSSRTAALAAARAQHLI
ncbi:MAG: response regulator transcription factor [Tetrasphaera sp.]